MGDRTALLACALCIGTAWAAEEAPDDDGAQDVEFIEYLGLWEESDEEWLMLDEAQDSEELPETKAEAQDER